MNEITTGDVLVVGCGPNDGAVANLIDTAHQIERTGASGQSR